MRWKIAMIALGAVAGWLVQSACVSSPAKSTQEQDVPLRVTYSVVAGPSYSRDIQPIFSAYCVRCHGSLVAENGLRLDSYENVMKGTKFGPVVVPKVSSVSTLMFVLDGTVSRQISMPQEDHRLTPNRIENVRYWIDAGAPNN